MSIESLNFEFTKNEERGLLNDFNLQLLALLETAINLSPERSTEEQAMVFVKNLIGLAPEGQCDAKMELIVMNTWVSWINFPILESRITLISLLLLLRR